jgi:hypothetical protein
VEERDQKREGGFQIFVSRQKYRLRRFKVAFGFFFSKTRPKQTNIKHLERMFKQLVAALALSSAAAFAPNSPISTKSAVVRYELNF